MNSYKDVAGTVPDYQGPVPVIDTISECAQRLYNAEFNLDADIFGADTNE